MDAPKITNKKMFLSTYCQPLFNFIVNIVFTKKPALIAFAIFYPKNTKIKGDYIKDEDL
jgi:hypothetical protein